MKHLLFSTLFLFVFYTATGQQFSFVLHFRDAIGDQDSLVIGYDGKATDSIDNEFGEVNIINKPWDSALEVRLTDRNNPFYIKPINGNFNLKKQIYSAPCKKYLLGGGLLIHTKHWPVTAIWDKSLFGDTCLIYSNFGSAFFALDYFVNGLSNLGYNFMLQKDSVSFTPNYYPTREFPFTGFVNEYQDTISNFWVFIGNRISTGTKDIQIAQKNISVFPNPASTQLNLHFTRDGTILKSSTIINSKGQAVLRSDLKVIDIHTLPPDIYILEVLTSTNQVVILKFIKL